MIKLIHIITDTNIGGAGVWVLNFLKAFDREKYEVGVALPTNSLLTPKIKELGIRTYEISGIADKSFSKEGINGFLKLFRAEKPDIVHCHASLSARVASRMLGIKTVNTRHCLENKKSGIKKAVYSLINNSLSDIVVGVSKATCENLLDDGTKEKKIRLIYNGVSPLTELSADEKKEIKREFGIPEENIVVGIVARLEKVKNHELFFEAGKILLDKYDNVTLFVAGEGTQKERLKNLCDELGISDRTVFCGYQKDVSKIMNIIDINALTSPKEALSLSLIEGMTLAKACVSTKSGGPCEVIDDGVTGLLAENDVKDFARKVSYYICNPLEREKAGQKGRERSEEIFSVDKMITSLDDVYEELMKRR